MAVPVVGLASSIVLAGEALTPAVGLSLVLILAGVGLGMLCDRRCPEPLLPAP